MGSAKKKKRIAVAVAEPTPSHQHLSSTTFITSFYFPASLLIIATALLYWYSLHNPLILDDLPFFVDANLKRLGSSFFHLDIRWFSYASFGWTYKLFGQDWFWYRLGNLALHALTSILLFVFFSRLLDAIAQPQDAVNRPHWLAFFAALIFALHPAAVYGVAYLIQRSIIMATLFGVAALLCYMEGLVRDRARWFVLSALFYFMAVFSKEHSIMIPGVAAALTVLLHKPSFALIKKVWLPFSLFLVIGTLITLFRTKILGTTYEYLAAEMLSRLSSQQEVNIENAYGLSVITEGFLFFKYLLLWVIPYTGWMSIDIRQPFATHVLSWPELPGIILFLAYPVLAIKLLLKGGRQGLLGFGLLFPWILYWSELATVRVQEPFVLYRSYLWMSGLPAVLLAIPASVPKKFLTIGLPVLCLAMAALAWNRLDTFSSDLKLWSDAVAKNHDEKLLLVERGYYYRGIAYFQSGQIQRAQDDFIKAVTLNPKYAEAHLNLGVTNVQLKNFQAALQSYNTAIELGPVYVTARIKRSTLFLQMGRNADALNDCEYALRLDTQNTDAYLNCGLAHFRMGRSQEALHYLDDALRISPSLVIAYINRSLVNIKLGRHDSALSDLDQAERIDPKDASIYYYRGSVHGVIGRFQEAMQDYNRAIELNPDYVNAYINRGGLYVILKRLPQAILEFDHAIQLAPNLEDAYIKRGHIFAMQSRYQDALVNYDQALRLNPGNGEAMQNRAAILQKLNKQK